MLDGGGVESVARRGGEGFEEVGVRAEVGGVVEDRGGFGVDLGAGLEEGGAWVTVLGDGPGLGGFCERGREPGAEAEGSVEEVGVDCRADFEGEV